jgi:small subunit ribosomal protein S13
MAYIYSTRLNKLDKTSRGIGRIYGMNDQILKKLQYSIRKAPRSRIFELTGEDIEKITNYLRGSHGFGGDGKLQKKQNIDRLIQINSYRGIRHFAGLPLRGQRTHTNAKTSRRQKYSRRIEKKNQGTTTKKPIKKKK